MPATQVQSDLSLKAQSIFHSFDLRWPQSVFIIYVWKILTILPEAVLLSHRTVAIVRQQFLTNKIIFLIILCFYCYVIFDDLTLRYNKSYFLLAFQMVIILLNFTNTLTYDVGPAARDFGHYILGTTS